MYKVVYVYRFFLLDCNFPESLGMENNEIPDNAITASSEFDDLHLSKFSRLNNGESWSPLRDKKCTHGFKLTLVKL